MKNFLSIIFSFLMLSAYAQNSDLKVEINNIESLKGNLLIALYNSEEGFPEKNEYKSLEIKPTAKTVSVAFDNLPHGIYAVAVLHDENENGKMDIGFLGPKESYGFSNNARGIFSAPSFEKASFELKENQTINIKIK